MAEIIFKGLALICAFDAVVVALLASARVSDPIALRGPLAMAGVILACGAVCLIAARVA